MNVRVYRENYAASLVGRSGFCDFSKANLPVLPQTHVFESNSSRNQVRTVARNFSRFWCLRLGFRAVGFGVLGGQGLIWVLEVELCV